MRKHEHTEVIYDNRWGIHREVRRINKGLKRIHIGNDVWLIGKQSMVSNPDKTNPNNGDRDTVVHSVIYAPNGKEHHIYGKTLINLCMEKEPDSNHMSFCNVNRHGNRALEGKVKIYILTTILDEASNWCFDLNKIPENGKLKVIYDNGTVKNIDFTGTFDKVTLGRKYKSGYYANNKIVTPIAYRKN